MDTTGGETLGRSWARGLGLDCEPDDVVGDPGGTRVSMGVVPESKTVTNRVRAVRSGDRGSSRRRPRRHRVRPPRTSPAL